MKLSRRQPDRTPRRRLKSAEALVRPEQPAEEIFDIREFLQSNDVQFWKMMATVVNPQPKDHELFLKMSWLSRLDPDFDKNFKESLGFKKFILEEFKATHEQNQGFESSAGKDLNFYIGLSQTYLQIFEGIQIFPELRRDPEVLEKISEDLPHFLQIISDPSVPLGDRVPMCAVFSAILPERRAELETALLNSYEGKVEKFLSDETHEDWEKPEMGLALLLFPEQAEKIKELLRPQNPHLVRAWETISKKQKHDSELEEYFGLALLLSLRTAEKVTISPEGQLVFELKAAPETPPAPLPTRPLT